MSPGRRGGSGGSFISLARGSAARPSAAFALAGCAGTYDVITSQRFKERPFHTLFVTEDPMEVLEKVQEGDDRVRAMHNLKEPKENGGTAAQQDRAIAILQESATTDKRPLVRMAAVKAPWPGSRTRGLARSSWPPTTRLARRRAARSRT